MRVETEQVNSPLKDFGIAKATFRKLKPFEIDENILLPGHYAGFHPFGCVQVDLEAQNSPFKGDASKTSVSLIESGSVPKFSSDFIVKYEDEHFMFNVVFSDELNKTLRKLHKEDLVKVTFERGPHSGRLRMLILLSNRLSIDNITSFMEKSRRDGSLFKLLSGACDPEAKVSNNFDLLNHEILPETYGNDVDSSLLNPEGLRATLRPYQRRSVAWMLEREGIAFDDNSLVSKAPQMPMLYQDYGAFRVWPLHGVYSLNPLEIPLQTDLRGGLLADEMGLGKTLEILSLLLIHRREDSPTTPFDDDDKNLILSKTTVIVAPSAIIGQWASEIKKHAPCLSVLRYRGTKKLQMSIESLANDYDILLMSYDEIGEELHYTQPDNQRSRRYERKYERKRSPLTRIKWWRVVLDEVQMVQNTMNKAAQVVSVLPRVNAWAVSGTPVGKRGLYDLYGTVAFLKLEPFASFSGLWDRLCSKGLADLMDAFLRAFVYRCMKNGGAADLQLPKQHDKVYKLSFTNVERHLYKTLRSEAFEDLLAMMELQSRDNEFSAIDMVKMNNWIRRLRAKCCHPEAGEGQFIASQANTITRVVESMYKRCLTEIWTLESSIHKIRVNRAQMLEFKEEFDRSIAIYQGCLRDIDRRTTEMEEYLKEVEKVEDSDAYGSDAYKRSLEDFKHQALFLIASCYHSLKDETKENEYYSLAENLRKEFLKESEAQFDHLFDAFAETNKSTMAEIKKLGGILINEDEFHGGIILAPIFEGFDALKFQLNEQWIRIEQYREKIIELTTLDLDEVGEDGPVGNEYERGASKQRECDLYMDAYSGALEDRRRVLRGDLMFSSANAQTEKQKKKKRRFNAFSDSIDPLDILKFELQEEKERFIDAIREISDFPSLLSNLKKAGEGTETMLEMPPQEYQLKKMAVEYFTSMNKKQILVLDALDKERLGLERLFNSRITYYRNLQRFSDGVVAAERPEDVDGELNKIIEQEDADSMRLARALGKRRYLLNMMHEAGKKEDRSADAQCNICQEVMREGLMTECGHFHCEDCAIRWVQRRKKCPVCNQTVLKQVRITFASVDEEEEDDLRDEEQSEFQEAMEKIHLSGSFGTKINTLIRHMKSILFADPTAKFLVFSQWQIILDVIASALSVNGISYLPNRGCSLSEKRKLDSENPAVQFQENPNIHAFLLHSKSQSAGLTLTAATHVFLVEPSLNTSIEQQGKFCILSKAINRVHRIGQTKETFVHRYLIKDSIEVKIMDKRDSCRLAQRPNEERFPATDYLYYLDK